MQSVNPSTSLRVNGERSRTIKFYTLGCKVNQYETQSMRESFLAKGYRELSNGKVAEVYLINTCSVTSVADRKSKSIIRHCIKQNPKAKIIVTGCLVEKDAAVLCRIEGIDFIIGKRFFKEGVSSFCGHTRAFLKVQDGCDNSCSYCKVPLIRGRSRSRQMQSIVEEAEGLVKCGFKEIVLCGICLGAYGWDLIPQTSLADMIRALEKIEGLLRIRLSSIEASDISAGMIQLMAGSKKICRHLHIPIQSGDDTILQKMNRRYRRADYLDLIERIKTVIPDIAITTDVLVGFPGETEMNFQNTEGLLRVIQPLKAHIFPYSKRQGTCAANFTNEISLLMVKERILRLKQISDDCALAYKRRFLNKIMEVLVEGRAQENSLFWEGHTDNYIKVLVRENKNLKNQLIHLKLKKIVKDYVRADFLDIKTTI